MDATRQNHPFQKLKHPRILNYSIQYEKVDTPTAVFFFSVSKQLPRKIYIRGQSGGYGCANTWPNTWPLRFAFLRIVYERALHYAQFHLFHTLGTNCYTCAGGFLVMREVDSICRRQHSISTRLYFDMQIGEGELEKLRMRLGKENFHVCSIRFHLLVFFPNLSKPTSPVVLNKPDTLTTQKIILHIFWVWKFWCAIFISVPRV